MKINQFIHFVFISIVISQSSYSILELPHNARALSISASSFTELPCNLRGANIVDGVNNTYSFSYLQYPQDIAFQSFAFKQIKRNSIFSISAISMDYGTFVEDMDNEDNYFKAQDILLNVEYNSIFQNFVWVGGNVSYIKSNISNYSSQIISSSFRIHSHSFNQKMGVSISLENLGIVIDPYLGSVENLPKFTQVSVSYKPQHLPAMLIIHARQYAFIDESHFIGSIEFGSRAFKLRVSSSNFKSNLQTGEYGSDFFAGLSAGVGLSFEQFKVDFGVRNLGAGGIVSGLTLGIKM
jgi:hypothetical protein